MSRQITLQVHNVSEASITVNFGMLTGGGWNSNSEPQPGSTINPGDNKQYINGSDNSFQPLGGQVLLTPASGGSINLSWSWGHGSGVVGTATSTSLNGLAVASSVVDTQTLTPTMNIFITDTAAAQGLASAS